MATSQPEALLDHVVIHLPHPYLENPPAWLTNLFTISPGGKHADGLTENRLILFSDGTYIELIAFCSTTTPQQKQQHFWGQKGYGLIDYAFTFPDSSDIERDFDVLQTRWASSNVHHGLRPPGLTPGGREKPDGTKIEWRVAFPDKAERGKAPFWCFDVTPRGNRVPLSKEATQHPSGALGVAKLQLYVHDVAREGLGTFFDATLSKNVAVPPKPSPAWYLSHPESAAGGRRPMIQLMGKGESDEKMLLQGRDVFAKLVLWSEQTDQEDMMQWIENDRIDFAFALRK